MPQSPSPLSPLPADSKFAKLEYLRRLSNLWDNQLSIPGTPLRVGLESLIGLLPVGGDIVGIIFSSYILLEAARMGLPKVILVRMLVNVIIDGAAGSVPVLGDLFDTTWKANTKNVNLIENHLRSSKPSRKAEQSFFILLFAGLMLVIIAMTAIFVVIIRIVLQAINH